MPTTPTITTLFRLRSSCQFTTIGKFIKIDFGKGTNRKGFILKGRKMDKSKGKFM